jgi:hypothetical protein
LFEVRRLAAAFLRGASSADPEREQAPALQKENASNMNQETNSSHNDELRREYDFSGGVRGKHYAAYRKGTNVVFLDPDIARVFKDSASVNRALRSLLDLAKKQVSAE